MEGCILFLVGGSCGGSAVDSTGKVVREWVGVFKSLAH